jgi:hypothetical protein
MLRGQLVQRDIDLLRRFVEDEDSFRPEQHRSSTVRNMTVHATPEELERLADEVSALFARYRRPTKAARPEDAERVHAVFWLVPRKDSDAR